MQAVNSKTKKKKISGNVFPNEKIGNLYIRNIHLPIYRYRIIDRYIILCISDEQRLHMYFMFRTGCIIPSASLDCKWDAAYRLLKSLEEFKV